MGAGGKCKKKKPLLTFRGTNKDDELLKETLAHAGGGSGAHKTKHLMIP